MEVITLAQSFGEIDPKTISYVEAHGTGTPLGDPIEIAALNQVFGSSEQPYCAIGSVKTNIGHLDAAAGIAGLIKTVLAMQHKQIPPSLNFDEPNPEIEWNRSPFYVNTELKDWDSNQTPRRAGVSAFGIGGTNAHLVVEEPPEAPTSSESDKPAFLFMLSAKSSKSLDLMTGAIENYMELNDTTNLADLAYTLQLGRKHFEKRRFMVAENKRQLQDRISQESGIITSVDDPMDRKMVFLFSGQGSQYVNMCEGIYNHEPIFKEVVDECAKLAEAYLELDIREILFADSSKYEASAEQLGQTYITQPALFIIEYALAQWWKSLGISPDIMVGHSIGEYAAACLSGVISLEDCIKLVCIRGRLMQELPSGSMLAVGLPEAELLGKLGNNLSIAVLNGPNGCVISGEDDDIKSFQAQLEEEEIDSTILKTSHAFHSSMMDPILDQFTDEVSKITLNAPNIPFYSNVSGKLITTQQATDPNYWAKHLRQTVRFMDCIDDLLSEEPKLFLEVGAGNTLAKFVKQNPHYSKDNVVLTSTRHPKDKSSDFQFMLHTIGNLWLSGTSIDWQALYQNEQRLRIRIPTYCFDRKKYWTGPNHEQYAKSPSVSTTDVDIKKNPNTSEWFYSPIWKVSTNQESPVIDKDNGIWLIFGEGQPLISPFIDKCQDSGIDIVSVSFGDEFKIVDDASYIINPNEDHYDQLFSQLKSRNATISKIVHLGNLGAGLTFPEVNEESFNHSQSKGLYSVLEISKALAKNGFDQNLKLEVVSSQMHAVTETDIPTFRKSFNRWGL